MTEMYGYSVAAQTLIFVKIGMTSVLKEPAEKLPYRRTEADARGRLRGRVETRLAIPAVQSRVEPGSRQVGQTRRETGTSARFQVASSVDIKISDQMS